MSAESRARYERFYGAISRKYMPDRVPVVPGTNPYAFANWYGSSPGEMNRNNSSLELSKKAIAELGPWDVDNRIALYFSGTDFMTTVELLLPGIDLPDDSTNVANEKEIMTEEDYDKLIEMGWEEFYLNYLWPKANNLPASDYAKTFLTMEQTNEQDKKIAKELDMELAWTNCCNISHPFFMLSLARSFTPFTKDLFFNGDKVEKCIKLINDYLIEKAMKAIDISGTQALEYTDERASAYMYPLKIFERFWLPYALEYVNAVWSRGVVTVLHLDTNWIKNLPYFLQFPKGSLCLQFDSTTPIVEAKKILGDHVQYWGDVPASMLAFAEPQEVKDYCNMLIREVGNDGGFVLAAGCEVPVDCKKENFEAMLEAARESKY